MSVDNIIEILKENGLADVPYKIVGGLVVSKNSNGSANLLVETTPVFDFVTTAHLEVGPVKVLKSASGAMFVI